MIIYKVTNIINNKIYIGQTTKSLTVRKTAHIYAAYIKKLPHRFYQAIRKYGLKNFTWEELTSCNSMDELNTCEIEQITKYDSFKHGYNMTMGGQGPLGKKCTKDTKLKMSKSNKRHRKGASHAIESNIQNAISNGGGRSFIVKDINANVVWKGLVLSQCVKDLKLTSVGNVSQCLHNKRKQHKGYTFEFEVA
jgi:group I intron endonuclease